MNGPSLLGIATLILVATLAAIANSPRRQSMPGVPYAPDAWNEIIDGLWMGGHDYQPDGHEQPIDAVVGDEFDLVVSLYSRWGCGPAEGVERSNLRIPDGVLNATDLAAVRVLAHRVAGAVRNGKQVLVRCQAGYNRSGLVVALAMLELGWDGDAAVRHIRGKRSGHALFNENFLGYIAAEAVALDLGGAW